MNETLVSHYANLRKGSRMNPPELAEYLQGLIEAETPPVFDGDVVTSHLISLLVKRETRTNVSPISIAHAMRMLGWKTPMVGLAYVRLNVAKEWKRGQFTLREYTKVTPLVKPSAAFAYSLGGDERKGFLIDRIQNEVDGLYRLGSAYSELLEYA